MTADSTLYRLNEYELSDSLLTGMGISDKNGWHLPFSGQIKLSDIACIQTSEVDQFRSLLAVGFIVFLARTVNEDLSGNANGISMSEKTGYYSPPTGGGTGESSCPYVYSWNGTRYVLEAEAFGIALGKALEMNTLSVLPSLREDRSSLKIKVANERPETHYLNSVRLIAAEVEEKASVFADPDNTLWPVRRLDPPIRAFDRFGKDMLGEVAKADQSYWQADLPQALKCSDFEDVIDLAFIRPSSSEEGSLVIQAINTNLSGAVFKKLFEIMGGQSLAFMHAVENDADLIDVLRMWTRESSLKVYQHDGDSWIPVGTVHPEATATPFSRLVRLRADPCNGDTVRVRLSCLTDVWKIDAIRTDWTAVQPCQSVPVRLLSAVGPGNKDVSSALEADDGRYAVLLPPDEVNLNFQAIQVSPGKKIVYAFDARGYLHEWETVNNGQDALSRDEVDHRNNRIAFLKNLLRQKSILLPQIYSEWMQMKNRNH